MNIIALKFKEVLLSVLPINVIVMILHFTISPMETVLILRFGLGSLLVTAGLTVFLLGVDIGITPLGAMTGRSILKTNNLWVVLIAGIILGFFISIAEPGLLVLANQVELVTVGQISAFSIILVVSIGLAILLVLGFLRIFYNIPLFQILIVLYLIIFGLTIFSSSEFLAISFDASGATTGILAVPFILSLSVGISRLKKDSKASEKDSFGLLAIASTGAIIAVLLLGLFSQRNDYSQLADLENSLLEPSYISIGSHILNVLLESLFAILPLFVIFLFLQKFVFKMNKKDLRKIITGFVFGLMGLFVFLSGVNAGFMEVGKAIGSNLALLENKIYVVAVGFLLGTVTTLAEPAVYVLTRQIEDVTSGYVPRKAVMITLAAGVGFAVSLSVLRTIVPEIELWHYLLPGYIICLAMMFLSPKLFVGIAFDAGGVATGPIIATFILAFIQGVANSLEVANVMVDGFGMIAMVAMMPIITLEFLGIVFARKSKSKGTE